MIDVWLTALNIVIVIAAESVEQPKWNCHVQLLVSNYQLPLRSAKIQTNQVPDSLLFLNHSYGCNTQKGTADGSQEVKSVISFHSAFEIYNL